MCLVAFGTIIGQNPRMQEQQLEIHNHLAAHASTIFHIHKSKKKYTRRCIKIYRVILLRKTNARIIADAHHISDGDTGFFAIVRKRDLALNTIN